MADYAHSQSRSWARGHAVPRQRGAINGTLMVLVGAWGALVPFFGPLIRVAYTPDSSWTYTTGRLWLDIIPGAVAVVAGLGVLGVAGRVIGALWAWAGALAGVWFVVGPALSTLWTDGRGDTGIPTAATVAGRALEQILFYYGAGAVLILLAGIALGRFTVPGRRAA
jgi:hypothetical protein